MNPIQERPPGTDPASNNGRVPTHVSVSQLRSMMEDSVIGISLASPDGVFVEVNPAFCKIVGFDRNEMLRTDFQTITHPDDLQMDLELVTELLSGKIPSYEIAKRYVHKTGRPVWVQLNVSLARNPDGSPLHFVAQIQDITGRKRQERELKRLNRLYSALSRLNQAIVQIDSRQELFVKLCEAVVESGGFEMAWIGWPENDALVPVAQWGDDQGYLARVNDYKTVGDQPAGPARTAFQRNAPCICNDIRRDASTQAWREESLRCGFRAKAAFPIRLGARAAGTLAVYANEPDFFQDKEIRLLESAAADLSFALENLARKEQQRVAEAIAERERDFSTAMIDSMPGVVYLYDIEGRFLRWNQNFLIVTGYSPEELARMKPLDFFAGDERELVRDKIGEAFKSGEALVEASFVFKDGSSRPYLFTGRRLLFDGEPCLVGMGIDITERKQALEELNRHRDNLEMLVGDRTAELQKTQMDLRKAMEAAESANRAKSAFLANMSHEIRTPMNAILGFAQIMERDPVLTSQQRESIGTIRRSGEHLLDLINDILETSKIEAGHVTLNPITFDLYRILEDLESIFRLRTESKRLKFQVSRTPRVPQVIVADEGKLRQVLLNLAGNAVKFTERGEIQIMVDCGSEDNRLLFQVRDTGPGISETDQKKLFQPFAQASAGHKMGGTGLGLAISKQFVALMGGSLSVQSEPGKGSCFQFQILFQPGQSVEFEERSVFRSRVEQLAPGQAPVRVLVVDDNRDNREILVRLLEPVGFETKTATDGVQAIALFNEWKPRMVLTDLRMPDMDGFELMREIRRNAAGGDAVILVITASAFSEDRQQAIDAGADGFLGKPFRERELFELIALHAGVKFLLTGQEPQQKAAVAIDSTQVAALFSAEAKDKFCQAALDLNMDLAIALIDEIEPRAPEVARQLRDRVERFDFQGLLDLFQAEPPK